MYSRRMMLPFVFEKDDAALPRKAEGFDTLMMTKGTFYPSRVEYQHRGQGREEVTGAVIPMRRVKGATRRRIRPLRSETSKYRWPVGNPLWQIRTRWN
jgi:hypothetical protein